PEDVTFVATPAAENNMSLKIVNQEPLGAETHLYLTTEKGQNMIARTTPENIHHLGDTVNFVPNMERAKFFDGEGDELNICDSIEKTW
nr:TOBE domain-containing protein [Treponema sp.]